MTRNHGLWLLWPAVLAGPLAWALQLAVEYFLVTLQCSQGAGDLAAVRYGTTALLIAVALCGFVLGWHARSRPLSGAADDASGERVRFMATAAMVLNVLFVAGILLASIPLLYLSPCHVA